MATKKTIGIVLKHIASAFQGRFILDEDAIKTWELYLSDLDDELLLVAVARFVSRHIEKGRGSFPPSIPEIRTQVAEVRREINRIPTADEAWADVLKMPRNMRVILKVEDNTIFWTEAKFIHPLVETVARRLGWPDKFPDAEFVAADRARFLDFFEIAVGKELQTMTQLPMISEFIQRNQLALSDRSSAAHDEDDQRAGLIEERARAFDTGEGMELLAKQFGSIKRSV